MRLRSESTLKMVPCENGGMWTPCSQHSPLRMRQNESVIWHALSRRLLTSVPLSTRPASNVSSIAYS